jgi:hypothetical protein
MQACRKVFIDDKKGWKAGAEVLIPLLGVQLFS